MINYLIELFFIISLFVNAALFIPQIIRLFQEKNARGVSFITFAGFNVINLLTLLHGVVNQDILLTVGIAFSLITNTIVTFLIVWYNLKNKKEAIKTSSEDVS